MPPVSLPAHLQNRQVANLTERASKIAGTAMPPRISIQGNSFTLLDAVGHEQSMGSIMEACVVDISDHVCKRFYPPNQKWGPDSKEAPVCFSQNGIAPSVNAQTPQSPTCASCEWNVRGSAQSQISGAAIKACRDEWLLALLFPAFPTMLFQLTITPGSFKNWGAYMKQFEQHQVNLADVLTEFSFQPKATGVLAFKPAAQIWIDPPTTEAADRALAEKATDALVGRLDKPIQAALNGPTQAQQPPFAQPAAQLAPTQGLGSSPAPASPFGSGSATPASAEPQKRVRRTKAQIEADAAAEKLAQHNAAQSGSATAAATQSAQAPTLGATPAPFRMATPPAGAAPFGAPQASNGNAFGMQQGVEPNKELQGALKDVFGS